MNAPLAPPPFVPAATDMTRRSAEMCAVVTPRTYVCGLMRDELGFVPLIRKGRPSWQAGLLNGVGGKIDQGEAPIDAMRREWREEMGCWQQDWECFARVQGPGESKIAAGLTGHGPPYDVWFFKAQTRELPSLADLNDAGEPIVTIRAIEVHVRTDVVSNLKWLMPLAFEDRGAPFAHVLDTLSAWENGK